MRGLNWQMDGVGVLAVEPANSTLRAINVSPHIFRVSPLNVPNWVAELDSFPDVRGNDDGYESGNSFLFWFEHKSPKDTCGGYFVVGSKAQQLRQGHTFVDTAKYDDCAYLSALMVTAMLENYPDGHNNLVLGVTHPFSYNKEYAEKIRLRVVGTYKVTTRDGKKVKFVVKKVLSFPETEGTINFLSTRLLALTKGLNVEVVKVFDWGHGTSHEINFSINSSNKLLPDYENARTYDVGGRNYIDMLSRHIAVTHKSELGIIADRVPLDNRLYESMDTGCYRAYGILQFDVADFVEEIRKSAALELRDIRDTRIYSRDRADVILWSGGSSRYFAREATITAFNKGFIWGSNSRLISEGDSLRFANLEGIRNQMLATANAGGFTPNA